MRARCTNGRNTGSTGDQTFLFIGGNGFSGAASELNFINGVLSGDTNGDKVADFQISISIASLATTDFYASASGAHDG